MRPTILVVNGPNLNMLGRREPQLYGHQTLGDIEAHLSQMAETAGAQCIAFQSNHEGALIDFLHQHAPTAQGIIINAGAYTHTSIALRDALLAVGTPFIEVHLSNVYAREPFRHQSLLADKAQGLICGLGVAGYEAAMRYWLSHLATH